MCGLLRHEIELPKQLQNLVLVLLPSEAPGAMRRHMRLLGCYFMMAKAAVVAPETTHRSGEKEAPDPGERQTTLQIDYNESVEIGLLKMIPTN